MERIRYNLNQSVFKAGDPPDKMFLVVKGKVGIFLPLNENINIVWDYARESLQAWFNCSKK